MYEMVPIDNFTCSCFLQAKELLAKYVDRTAAHKNIEDFHWFILPSLPLRVQTNIPDLIL